MARGSGLAKTDVKHIRGWLLVLCVLLLVWQPFSLALTTAGTLDELSLRGSGLAVILVARLFAAGLGIAAGLSLFQRKPGAVSIAKSLAANGTPFRPSTSTPSHCAKATNSKKQGVTQAARRSRGP